ncbi:MAG: hypothetical protein HRU43_00100 [Simkaniaceae bacterium]|nr:hypothetical protein [Simkaniaceae bacterium]
MENTETKNDPYLLNGLIADLSSERAKLAQMTGHLSILNDRIKEDIDLIQNEFKEAQTSLAEQLSEGLRDATKELADKSFNAFRKNAFSKTDGAMSKLETLANRTYSNINDLTRAQTMGFKKLLLIMSIGGILSGTIGALSYGLFVKKFDQTNPRTNQYLAWGIALEKSWHELTDKEQGKLNKLLQDHAP